MTTFITRSTTPAAGSGAWMWNARIAAQTASSWQTQPAIWNEIASAMPTGERITPKPWRAIATTRRAAPRPSRRLPWSVRALTIANVNRPRPMPTTATRMVIAHAGTFAVTST